jgi:hypothetical protein
MSKLSSVANSELTEAMHKVKDARKEMEELNKAHEQWLKEKEEAIKKLQYARMQLDAFGYNWCIERSNDLKEVIDFINKGEI